MIAPCKDCGKRILGCYTKCVDYQTWKQFHNSEAKEIRKQRKLDDDIVGIQISSARQRIKRRNGR